MTDMVNEFPRYWHASAKLSPNRHDPSLNYFGVSAGQRCQFGLRKDGFTPTIRVAGFNGIVAITSGAAYLRKMLARSDDGRRCSATFATFRRIANPAICAVDVGNDKRCSSGLMTVEAYKFGAET
jgi:hypothetical protein